MKNIPIDNTCIFVYQSFVIEKDRHKTLYCFCKLGGTSSDIIVNQVEDYYIVVGDIGAKVTVTVKKFKSFDECYHQFITLKQKVVGNIVKDISNKICSKVLATHFDRTVIYKKNNVGKLTMEQIVKQLNQINRLTIEDPKLVKKINDLTTLVSNTASLFQNNRDNLIDQRNEFYKCYNKWNSAKKQLSKCKQTIDVGLIESKFANIENYQGFN